VTHRVQVSISWNPPSLGWVKLNTDGVNRGGLVFGCGEMISGTYGNWIRGFSKYIVSCNVFVPEL
jgi:hypothetical protein